VLHRQNLDAIEDILLLAEELGAQRLELANTQYYGWAVVNQAALMPTREQLERGEEAVKRTRERLGRSSTSCGCCRLLRGLPSVHGRLGHDAIVVARTGTRSRASGDVDPRLDLPSVRDRSLEWIWPSRTRSRASGHRLDAGAVQLLPARPAGAGFRGCRCQALRDRRRRVRDRSRLRYRRTTTSSVAARDAAQSDDFTYRTMRRRPACDGGGRGQGAARDYGSLRAVATSTSTSTRASSSASSAERAGKTTTIRMLTTLLRPTAARRAWRPRRARRTARGAAPASASSSRRRRSTST